MSFCKAWYIWFHFKIRVLIFKCFLHLIVENMLLCNIWAVPDGCSSENHLYIYTRDAQLQAECSTRSIVLADTLQMHHLGRLQKQEDPLQMQLGHLPSIRLQMWGSGTWFSGELGRALWLDLIILPSFYDTSVYYNFWEKQEENNIKRIGLREEFQGQQTPLSEY